MEQFYLQFKDEQKWASEDSFYYSQEVFTQFQEKGLLVLAEINKNPIKYANISLAQSLEADIEGSKKIQADFEEKMKDISSVEERKSYAKKEFVVFSFPSPKAATRLAKAFTSNYSFLDNFAFSKILHFLETLNQQVKMYQQYKPLFSIALGEKNWTLSHYQGNPYSYSMANWENASTDSYIKTITKLEKEIANNKFVEFRATTENSLMDKKAWAIFCQFEHGGTRHVGYKAKNGELGDISTARLFESDKGAKRTAGAMGLTENSYDIVELHVEYKKRCHLTNGFNCTELDEAEAILEKQRIETFFNDISVEKIEEKLEEVKAKKKNKI